VSPGELYAVLQSLENGKAPGIEDLPVEFYKSLWSVVGGGPAGCAQQQSVCRAAAAELQEGGSHPAAKKG